MDGQDELTPAEALLARRIAELGATPSATAQQRIMAAVLASLNAAPNPLLQHPGRRSAFRSLMLGLAAAAAVSAGAIGAIAASAHALPNSPVYRLRVAGEGVRLATSDTAGKEQLRIGFARDRLAEAHALRGSEQSAATEALLKDAQSYLSDAQQDLSLLPEEQRNQVQSEIDKVEGDEHAAELEAIQQGTDRQDGAGIGASGPAPEPSTSPFEPSTANVTPSSTPPASEATPSPPEATPSSPEATPSPPEATPWLPAATPSSPGATTPLSPDQAVLEPDPASSPSDATLSPS